MAAEDARSLEEIRDAKLLRLRALEKEQARKGFSTPPEVVVEIAQLRSDLGIVENAIAHPASVQTAEEIGPGARWLATDRKLDLLFKMLTERMDRMEEHADERYRTQEAKHDRGAQLYQFLFILLSIGLIISLVIGAFLIGGAFR